MLVEFLFYDDSYQSSPPSHLVTVPRLLGLLKALGGQRLVLRGIRFLRPGIGWRVRRRCLWSAVMQLPLLCGGYGVDEEKKSPYLELRILDTKVKRVQY